MREWLRRWLGINAAPLVAPKKRAAWPLIDLAKPRDPYRTELKLPWHPSNVQKPAADMAMDFGGLPGPNWDLSGPAGIGSFNLYFPGYQILSELAQRPEYREPAATIARESTRKWITFKTKGGGQKDDKIAVIEDEFKRFRIREKLRKVAMHDNLFGGAFMYIDIKGQEEVRAKELLIDEGTVKVGMLNGFEVVEPIWVTPVWWNSTDPTAGYYYKPRSWVVLNRETHATRLMSFMSREVPDYIKPAFNFLGISLSQLIREYVDRWLMTVGSVNRLINNFSIINLSTDMAALLEGSDLVRRMQDFIEKRNNQGMFLTDKNIEELKQLAVPLSSLDLLQAQAQEHMAMPTHIPLIVLTGVTPAGLNRSDQGEIEVWHDFVLGYQEDLYTDHLDTILKLVQLNKWGSIDPDIVYDYMPLKEVDGEAEARIRKSDGERATAYIDAGVIAPDEERKRIAKDPDSGFNNLDVEREIEPPALEQMDRQAEHESASSDESEAA